MPDDVYRKIISKLNEYSNREMNFSRDRNSHRLTMDFSRYKSLLSPIHHLVKRIELYRFRIDLIPNLHDRIMLQNKHIYENYHINV